MYDLSVTMGIVVFVALFVLIVVASVLHNKLETVSIDKDPVSEYLDQKDKQWTS